MNKKYLILPLIVVLLGGAFLAGRYTRTIPTSGTASGQGVIHGGLTCYQITRADGTVEDLGCRENLFMDEGKAFLADEIGTDNSTNCVDTMWLASDNFTADASASSFDVGATVITGNSLSASDCTGFHVGNWADEGSTGNITASCLWTATGTQTVWSTALNCSGCAAGTEFFAVNNFTTAATLSSGDQLNVTWYVWSS